MIADLDREHANMVLATQHVGRLACCLNDQPYIVPVTYTYDDGYIYGHTNDGRKIEMLRQNPHVCFEVDVIETMTKWRSVIANGTFEELHGRDAARALDRLFEQLGHLETSESAGIPENLDHFQEVARKIKLRPTKGVTYRIKIDELTGRYERP
jgi:nitroimidazol reductase NimA-like FMN-containing flavoprotein (pyridoxamine 5'-phosphate oxidase superfamily)